MGPGRIWRRSRSTVLFWSIGAKSERRPGGSIGGHSTPPPDLQSETATGPNELAHAADSGTHGRAGTRSNCAAGVAGCGARFGAHQLGIGHAPNPDSG